jgi:putative tricarboxylic transport membrane protein
MARHLRNAAVLAALSLSTIFLAPGRAAAETIDQLTIMAPAAPGGGWDSTARAMQEVLQIPGRG